MGFSQDNGVQKRGRDIKDMPFGVGDYPGYILEFFNWGAFSQPILWSVVYGIWPLFLVTMLAMLVPFAISLVMGGLSADSAQMFFYSLIISLLFSTIARLFVGMRANELLWRHEKAFIKVARDGQPRWNMDHFLSRQMNWTRYGMAFYVAAALSTGILYSTSLETSILSTSAFALLFPAIWLVVSVLAGRFLSNRANMRLNTVGLYPNGPLERMGGFIHELTQEPADELKREPDHFVEKEHVSLNDGHNIPALGFGTYKITDAEEARHSVLEALKAGYRHIDTASFYQNEEAIGRAIKESGIPRKEIFITSKLWQDQQGYAATVVAFEETISRLGVDYLDLYLIHWPVQSKLAATWKALEHLKIAGKIRSIGVCNFEIEHLEELLKVARIVPAINQIELHPTFARNDVFEYCKQKGIRVEAWAPLARGAVFENETLIEIGKAHGRTAGQVALRWMFQKEIIPLPKSVHTERIAENFDIFDFMLTPDEMKRIDALDAGNRIGPDPNTFSWEWPKSSRN